MARLAKFIAEGRNVGHRGLRELGPHYDLARQRDDAHCRPVAPPEVVAEVDVPL